MFILDKADSIVSSLVSGLLMVPYGLRRSFGRQTQRNATQTQGQRVISQPFGVGLSNYTRQALLGQGAQNNYPIIYSVDATTILLPLPTRGRRRRETEHFVSVRLASSVLDSTLTLDKHWFDNILAAIRILAPKCGLRAANITLLTVTMTHL